MRACRFFVIAILILLCGRINGSESLDAAKGSRLLKSMSEKLAAATHFSFSTTEFRDGLDRKGEKSQTTSTRDVLVRRPNGFWTKYSGDRDWEFWYDGKLLTGVSSEKKIYVQHEMPSTLDDAIDMLAERLNMDLPMSDVLYSSPYDAFVDSQTKGGFAGNESINGSTCGHLAYTAPLVDWQLWIDSKTSLPCKLELTYKKETGNTFYRITFSNWNLSAKISDAAFAFKIPEGAVRIPMLERVLLQKGDAAQTQSAPANSQ